MRKMLMHDERRPGETAVKRRLCVSLRVHVLVRAWCVVYVYACVHVCVGERVDLRAAGNRRSDRVSGPCVFVSCLL